MIEIGNEDVETSSLLRGLVERVEAACMGAVASLPAEVGGALIECSAAGSLLRPEQSYRLCVVVYQGIFCMPIRKGGSPSLRWYAARASTRWCHGHYTWCAYCCFKAACRKSCMHMIALRSKRSSHERLIVQSARVATPTVEQSKYIGWQRGQ